MRVPERKVPDSLDLKILGILQKDARTSWRVIAKGLGVSTPTVARRVRRMEEAGLILGYRAEVAGHTAGRAREKPWPCAHCGSAIQGPARTVRLGGRDRAFCCGLCRDAYVERYRRLSRG